MGSEGGGYRSRGIVGGILLVHFNGVDVLSFEERGVARRGWGSSVVYMQW